jgi:thiol-disulfide isomerase/thioredoxin
MRILTISCALFALGACHKPANDEQNNQQASAQAAPAKGADRSHRGDAMPAAGFNDPSGHQITLANFRGKPTLVNLWATWCAPCVKELPTLDRLVRNSGGRFNLVAISQDSAPHASVEAFLKAHGIETLSSYQDPKMALSGALHADVLPTSVLFDANGKEVWRYVGDLDWTSPEAAKLLAEASASTPG